MERPIRFLQSYPRPGGEQVRRGPTSLTEFEVNLADMYVHLTLLEVVQLTVRLSGIPVTASTYGPLSDIYTLRANLFHSS
jgi:hypothetical protein